MITPAQWSALRYLGPGDFSGPDGLEFAAVKRLDGLAILLRSKPLILSDKRPFDENNPGSQHFYGTAIDSTWPGVASLRVVEVTESSGLYATGGFGVYVNEAGVVSFHHDTRGTRARWGGMITHPMSSVLNQRVKRIEYTGIAVVLDLVRRGVGTAVQAIADLPVEKKSAGVIFILAVLVGVSYFKRRR